MLALRVCYPKQGVADEGKSILVMQLEYFDWRLVKKERALSVSLKKHVLVPRPAWSAQLSALRLSNVPSYIESLNIDSSHDPLYVV